MSNFTYSFIPNSDRVVVRAQNFKAMEHLGAWEKEMDTRMFQATHNVLTNVLGLDLVQEGYVHRCPVMSAVRDTMEV